MTLALAPLSLTRRVRENGALVTARECEDKVVGSGGLGGFDNGRHVGIRAPAMDVVEGGEVPGEDAFLLEQPICCGGI